MIPFGLLPKWAVSTSEQSNSHVRCARIICENKPELEVTQLWDLELLVRLFSFLCHGTNNSTLFGVCPTFRSRTTAFIIFFFFSMWILIFAGARKTQEDTL